MEVYGNTLFFALRVKVNIVLLERAGPLSEASVTTMLDVTKV